MTTTALAPASPLALAPSGWLDPALYPFTPRSFETEDGRLSFLDEGEGPPILFVHGTPSWSFEWRHAVRALRGAHRCIAPDHLGFGLSDKPPGAPYEPSDHARRLLALVRHLDLRDVTLVVHDFGGPIGLPVALEEPERVRAVVAMNTWMWAHGDRGPIRTLSRFVASPLGRFLYTRLNASPRWLVPASFGDRAALTPAVHRHYLAPFPRAVDRIAPWALGRALAGADPYYASLWDRRAALAERPLSLIWGAADRAFGEPYLARWREAFPDAPVLRLEGVGHFPQEEAPERVTEAIRRAAEAG